MEENQKIIKKLLILAYDFPPYVSVGGLRPYAWYNYLKEFGVYPIVVTRQWSNDYGDERDYVAPSKSQETIIEKNEYGTIIRTPYKPNLANKILLKYGNHKFALIRKAISAFYEFSQFIFFIGPKSGLYQGAKNYLKTNRVDAIIATGEPFVLFKYASKLSTRHSIPWIADYRDPWSQNIKNKNILIRLLNTYFEKKYTLNTFGVTTVNDFLTKRIYCYSSKNIDIITNGYNPNIYKTIKNCHQRSDKLRIGFMGTIYPWHPLISLLDCFLQIQRQNSLSNVEINFWGINNKTNIEHLLNTKYNELKKYINIYPRKSNDKLLATLSSYNILLLFNDYSIIGTKIFDYLALQRLILFCYSDDKEALVLKDKYYGEDKELLTPQQDLIRKTDSGIIVKDKNELLEILPKLFEEFQLSGKIKCHTHDFEQYSRKKQTEKLANIVKSL